MALLFAYGIHLLHGGDADSFGNLTDTDIQIIISTEVGLRKMSAQFTADAIAKMFSREE